MRLIKIFIFLFLFVLISCDMFSQGELSETDSLKISIEDKNAEIILINKKFEHLKELTRIEIQESKLKQKYRLYYTFGLLSVLLVIFIFVVYITRFRLKKSNILLSRKNEEINKQQIKIEEQKDKLTLKAADLLVLNMKLKEIDNLKDGLTAMLVHDLKNPINNILNLTENKDITSFANQMLNIVTNILDVQKYENSIMDLNKKDYFAFKVVDHAIQEIKLLAEHKNIKVVNNVSRDYTLEIDVEIIQRVFVNLMTNSIKYTPANGTISVSSEFKSSNKKFLCIKVTDTGIGIQKNKIDTIFNKFNQVIAKKSGHARSTGLGLTFCKMAVEAHGGIIIVTSVPDQETSFAFSLPLAKKQAEVQNINGITFKDNLDINLNESEKEYLNKYILDLKEIEVYDISNLRKLTKKIDETVSDNIKIWKKELSKAIFNCNEELYRKILDISDINQII